MPSAAEQSERNREIIAARAAGEDVESLARRFGLSSSRVKQILRSRRVVVSEVATDAVAAASRRRSDYLETVGDLQGLARRLPDSQAAAKVGCYRALLDALDRLTNLERALGFLPSDLGQLRSERALVEAVLSVFVEHEVSSDARRALVDRLHGGP